MKRLTLPQIYAFWNGIAGLIIGIAVDIITRYSWIFAIGATFGAALSAYVFWNFVLGKSTSKLKLFFCAFFTGTVSHFLCWFFMFLMLFITGNSDDNPFAAAIFGTFYSVLLLGWFSVLLSFMIGLILLRTNK